MAAVGQPMFLYVMLALYGMFDFVNSVSCFTMKNIQPQFLLLPLIFPLLHVAYGVGTVVGLLDIPFWKRKLRDSKSKEHIEEVKRKIKENTIVR